MKDIIDSLKKVQERIESEKKKSRDEKEKLREKIRRTEAGTRLCPMCNNIISFQDLTCGHPQCVKEVEGIFRDREKEIKVSEDKIRFLEEDINKLLGLLGVDSIDRAEKRLQELHQVADGLSESLEG